MTTCIVAPGGQTSGRLDLGVLGAYEVAANGDFANWKLAGSSGGIG